MATRSTRFQVEFTTDGSGNVRAELLSVGKAAEDAGKKAQAAGRDWEAFGRGIGTSIRAGTVAAAAAIALVGRNSIAAQQEMAQLDAVLKSTGQDAAFSRQELTGLAEAIARASTYSAGEITKAETRLLSYSGIARDNFAGALQIAIDQAARLGISVEQSSEIVGRALESPTKAAAALAQQGFGAAFTDSVRKSIKALEDAGREAEAQRMVMDILTESYGGAAQAARDTLGGALQALRHTLEDLTTAPDGSLDAATAGVNTLIDTLNDPAVREGFSAMTGVIASLTAQMAEGLGLLTQYIARWQEAKALRDGGSAAQTSAGGIERRQEDIRETLESMQRREAGLLGGEWSWRDGYGDTPALSAVQRQRLMRGGGDNARANIINELKREMLQLDAELARRNGPQVQLLENGALPEGALNPAGRVPVPSGGEPDKDAERRANRIASALRAAQGVAADWQRELDSTGNPILDRYADRLAKVQDQAERLAQAKVPADKIREFTTEMNGLAEQLRDQELAEYQREFAAETEAMAATLAGPGVEAALRYAKAMEDLRKQQELGLVTADVAAERERYYADVRDSAATGMIAALQEERATLGMSALDLEVYDNLKRAGVDASSEMGQAVEVLTRQLQREREAIGAINDTASAFHEFGAAVLMNTSQAGNALDQFAERMKRIAANMIMDKMVQMAFGALMGGWGFGGGAYTGNGTGAGSMGGFGNNLDNFTGNPYAGLGGGRATGGGVNGSGIYEVTEYGRPELLRRGGRTYLMPGQDGVVLPAREAGASAGPGAGGVQINFQVENNAGAEVRMGESSVGADGSLNLRMFLDAAKQHVDQAILGGGSTARAIQSRFAGMQTQGRQV